MIYTVYSFTATTGTEFACLVPPIGPESDAPHVLFCPKLPVV